VASHVQMLSFGTDTAWPTIILPLVYWCRWYVVRSQPRNLLFRCTPLLLWKPHSWF